MAADKKIERDKLPHPEKADRKSKNQEEFDDKSKTEKGKKGKTNPVGNVVRDLPIY